MKNILTVITLIIFNAFMNMGCLVSQIQPVHKFARDMIGEPIEDIIEMNNDPQSYASRIGWIEKKYNIDNGAWVYVTPMRRDCFVHWEISPEGDVVGYKTEGDRCF